MVTSPPPSGCPFRHCDETRSPNPHAAVREKMGDWSISTPNRDTANICERHFGHNKGAAPEPGYHASGFSFLSGHSTDAAVAAGIVRWLVAARLGRRGAGRPLLFALVIGYAAAVGASRVYLGIHWPTDVFGGWAFAVAWLACTVWVMSSAGGGPRAARPIDVEPLVSFQH